ncbi:hypothetical protein WJX79_001719 [Trebouxia sp. C0005]
MTTKRSSTATPGQRSISTFFAAFPASTPNGSAHSKKQIGRPSTTKQTRTPATDPSPLPAKPASADKSAHKDTTVYVQGSALKESAVGRRVQVYWDGEQTWFSGKVGEFDGHDKHLVLYDDGDEEWVDLTTDKIRLAPQTKTASGKQLKGRKRKQVLMSESDDSGGGESDPDSGSDWSQAGKQAASSDADNDDDDVSMADHSDDSPAPAGKGQSSSRKRAKPTPGQASKAAQSPSLPAKLPSRTPGTGGRPPTGKTSSLPAKPPNPSSAARDPAAKGQLTSKLERSSSTPLVEVVAGGTGRAIQNSDTERYAARAADKFTFLRPDRVMDARRRRPDHPDYDPSTLHIPDNWFKANKISEGQQQWWEFKARHFDSTMLFKMGKFYEMFEMDAHVGVEILGLIYMKGEQPHCGFPEKNYHHNAERLARAGLKVVVVEQTETPDQLRIRNEERKANKQNQIKVVNRELVAVLTQATLTDAEMLQAHPDAAYLLSITEQQIAKAEPGQEEHGAQQGLNDKSVRIGICAVDVATARILLGQWDDDEMRTGLRGHITALMPQEIILPKGKLSSTTSRVLRASLCNPRQHQLAPGDSFWDAATTLQEIDQAGYFKASQGQQGDMPPALHALVDARAACEAAVSALGGCINHLRTILLDKSILPVGQLELLPGCVGVLQDAPVASNTGPHFMALDGAALQNLEVLESSQGGRTGSLMGALDNCTTPAGKRLLSQWLCRPLLHIADIAARQNAVQDLISPECAEAVGAARKAFSGVGDLERSLARLNAAGLGGGMGRDAMKVVLYEDNAKRRVAAMIAGLRGLQTLNEAFKGFQAVLPALASGLLQQLLTPGKGLPELDGPLDALERATDWHEAAASGRAIPRPGVDKEYDDAEGRVKDKEADLAEYLDQIREQLGAGRDLCYVTVNKDVNLLEIPQALQKAVPQDFELMGQRKGFVRYMNPSLRSLVKQHADALETRELALTGILQGLLARFASQAGLWQKAVKAMSELDALMALAYAAQFGGDGAPMCRPTFLDPHALGASQPAHVFEAKALRHPAAGMGIASGGSFVPNDIQLGGEAPGFIVLTGPNMGGKSTLLRQVCLAALMAQVGAWVPADSLTLTPVDAIFVRMGAKDDVMSGQSTFFVELAETAAALNKATPASLVALDELGRGTATSDGAAIAAAVLEHLSAKTCCRGLFATHYHRLADAHEQDPKVAICHMGCSVEPGTDGGPEQVTFLYNLTNGACPKSYGVNVARLAGLPDEVINRAASFARQLEEQHDTCATLILSQDEQQRLCSLCQAAEQNRIGAELQA